MHVFLTGASAGIGEGLARAFGAAGHDLTLVARRRDRLEDLARAIGDRVRTRVVPYDLAQLDGLAPLVPEAEAALGPIDVLVNNAGVQIVGRTRDVTVEESEWQYRIDVLAPLRLTRAVLPAMLDRRAGTIVNVSSVAAFAPTPGMFDYSCAKAGLAAASESLRGELLGSGVNVLTVYPGPVKTDMADRAVEHFDAAPPSWIPMGTTDVLARRTLAAITGRHARVIYPRFYWITRWFPGITRFVIDHATPPLKARPA
jgi:short-subunit dehydrogenase